VIQNILGGAGLFAICKAGTRLMGRPTPVNSTEPREDGNTIAMAR